MHEMGITKNIVAIVSEHAGKKIVNSVTLEIGRLSAVMPDAIRFCFDVCSKNTVLESARLEIIEIEGLAKCNDCNNQFTIKQLAGICQCGSRKITCIAGEELNIKQMEVI